jgi:glyoxylate utilization-related uncharacterized protein
VASREEGSCPGGARCASRRAPICEAQSVTNAGNPLRPARAFEVALEGTGTLDVEDTRLELREGHAVFVPAGADHRFSAYEHLSVLVIFEKRPK